MFHGTTKESKLSHYKNINTFYIAAVTSPDSSASISALKVKNNKIFAKCKSSSVETTKANHRTKQAFFKSINNVMHNMQGCLIPKAK